LTAALTWSKADDAREWDEFVTRNHGSVFHQWAWRQVLESEHPRPLYLACRDQGGSMVAACPFFYKEGKHFMYLDSLPDSLMAGPVVGESEGDRPRIIDSMRKSVKSLTLMAMRVRIHQKETIQMLESMKFRHDAVANGLLMLDLESSTPEFIWNSCFQRHDRRAVKTYEKEGAEFRFAEGESDYSDYLSLDSGTTWEGEGDMGLLASRLSRMRQFLGERFRLALVTLGGEVAVGLPLLLDDAISTIHTVKGIRYSSARNIHEPMANSTFIDWKVANWAAEHGFRYVDFGSYPIGAATRPKHVFSDLRSRFGLSLVPWYRFTLPTSGIFPVARQVSRLVRDAS